MTITLSYPGGKTLQSYIDETTVSYLEQYGEEFGENRLKVFVGEIAAKIANIIDFEVSDQAKINKINELQLLSSEAQTHQLELGAAFSQASISCDSDSGIDEMPTPIEDLAFYVNGEKSVIYANLRKHKMPLDQDNNIERLQDFIKEVAKRCIAEICDATLEGVQVIAQERPESPGPNTLPRGANSLEYSGLGI